MQVHSKGSISALDGKLTVELEFQPDSEEEQLLITAFLSHKVVIDVTTMKAVLVFDRQDVHEVFAQSLAEHNAKKGENALAIPLEAYRALSGIESVVTPEQTAEALQTGKALLQDLTTHMTGVGGVPLFGETTGTATAVSHEGATEASTVELTSALRASDATADQIASIPIGVTEPTD